MQKKADFKKKFLFTMSGLLVVSIFNLGIFADGIGIKRKVPSNKVDSGHSKRMKYGKERFDENDSVMDRIQKSWNNFVGNVLNRMYNDELEGQISGQTKKECDIAEKLKKNVFNVILKVRFIDEGILTELYNCINEIEKNILIREGEDKEKNGFVSDQTKNEKDALNDLKNLREALKNQQKAEVTKLNEFENYFQPLFRLTND